MKFDYKNVTEICHIFKYDERLFILNIQIKFKINYILVWIYQANQSNMILY